MSKKSNNKSGMSMKTKWIITGILCVLAVLTVVVVAADGCFDFRSRHGRQRRHNGSQRQPHG